MAGEMAKAAEARLNANRVLFETTKAQVAAGKGIEASLRRLEAEIADSQRTLITAQNDEAKMLLELKAILGVHLESEFSLADAPRFQPLKDDQSAYLKEANANRPELKALRSRFAASGVQRKSAQEAFSPQVYGGAMADASASQGSSGVNYTIGVTFSLPLSDGGQRRSDLDKAKALQERAKAETMQAEQRISKEVRQVWLDVETAKQSYETSRTALEAAQSAYEITALRVQNQKAILVEQLDALASMTQTRTNLAVSLYEYEIAVAKLLRLSGYNNP